MPKLFDFAADSSVFVCINRRITERRGPLATDVVEGNNIRAASRTTGDLENRVRREFLIWVQRLPPQAEVTGAR